MKRIIALILVIAAILLVGCSSKSGPKPVEKETVAKQTVAPQESTTNKVEETKAPEKTLLWSTTIAFDENNKIDFYVSEENPNKLYAMCNFDGKNTAAEYTRVFCIVAVATELGFGQNLFIAISSGENVGMISLGGNFVMELPETYVSEDDTVRVDTIDAIRNELNKYIQK